MPAPRDGAILVVYPFCLDHVGHGNIQRILAIARHLASRGLAVDLVYQGSPRVAPVESQYSAFRRVFAVEGGASSSDEAACATRLEVFYSGHDLPPVHMRPSAPLTTLVRGLIEAEPYRAVVATYAFTAPIFAGLRRQVLAVCDVQDVMHEHAEACEKATGHTSSFTMPAATEAFLWRQWDALVAITPDDQARIARDLLPGQHLVSARHAAACAPAPAPGLDDVALYAASDNQSNVQSVSWLLEQVWPLVRAERPTARLRMAGLICAAVPDHLRTTPGLELLGFRDDISDELTTCGVLLAPYLYGSGLKIKVVEAACAGKAIVTTASGLAGTGLVAGRALEVHDDAPRFADAVSRLLGDRASRQALAEAARVDAAALFSAEACYDPIAFLIRMFGAAPGAPAAPVHALSTAALERLRLVVDHVRPARVVVWGNGAFTRGLLAALAAAGLDADVVVDGRATAPGTSPEGLPIAPKAQFAHRPGDLVVLSSETFEHEMWRDLAACRDAGGHVLGLCDLRLLSRGLLDRLSAPLRHSLGATPLMSARTGGGPAVVLWDSGADVSRWWRLHRQRDLAAAVMARGATAVVACRAALAARPDVIEGLGRGVQVLPVIECGGDDLEARDIDGSVRGLAASASLAMTTGASALTRLRLTEQDVLLLLEPSLSECLGLARALAAAPLATVPLVAVWTCHPERRRLHLAAEPQQAYWRLALETLSDASGRRLAVVTPDAVDADRLSDYLQRPVRAVGHPGGMGRPSLPPALARLAVFGQVSTPGVRDMLEALVEAAVPGRPLAGASLVWRSDQHDARVGAGDRWALDLASVLGIRLLDDATPTTVAEAIADADVVVVLAGASAPWGAHVAALAAASGVPVVQPATPSESVSQVLAALGTRRPPIAAASPSATFDRLLAALAPVTLSIPLSAVPHAVPSQAFVPEIRP